MAVTRDREFLKFLNHEVRDHLEVLNVLRDNLATVVQRGCPDQEIRKRKDNASPGLLAGDRACPLCYFIGERMHSHGGSEFLQERLPPLPLCFRLRSLDAMREFDDGDSRQTGPRLAPFPLDLLQYLCNTTPAPLGCDQIACVDY